MKFKFLKLGIQENSTQFPIHFANYWSYVSLRYKFLFIRLCNKIGEVALTYLNHIFDATEVDFFLLRMYSLRYVRICTPFAWKMRKEQSDKEYHKLQFGVTKNETSFVPSESKARTETA